MKVKLSLVNRIKLSELLADEAGSFARLKMIREFRESLSFTEHEIITTGYMEVATDRGTTISSWAHPEKDPRPEYDISDLLVNVICLKLRKMDNLKQLTQDKMGLYELFQSEIEKLNVTED